MEIYLDNAATTKPLPQTAGIADRHARSNYFNPSALYRPSAAVHTQLNSARRNILAAANAENDFTLVFNSGGSEGNNTVMYNALNSIKGMPGLNSIKGLKPHYVLSEIEHTSVYEWCKQHRNTSIDVDFVSPDKNGLTPSRDIVGAIKPNTVLVSLMHVNNETGVINDIGTAANAVAAVNPNTRFHTDGVQAFMKMNTVLDDLNVTYYTVSAHKIHGLKGTGGLFIRKGTKYQSILLGGGQENGHRAGTENTLGIAVFDAAVAEYSQYRKTYQKRLTDLGHYLKSSLNRIPDAVVNSPELAVPYIINVSFPGVRSEVLVHTLEEKGIYIGTGSACSSKKTTGSRILKAMGLSEALIESAVRLSLSHQNTFKQIDITLTAINQAVKLLRRYTRR